MDILAIVLRILHIAAAVLFGGGLFFQALILAPWLRGVGAEQRDAIQQRIGLAWSRLVWTCIAVLLLSGLVNYLLFQIPAYRAAEHKGTYHGLMGVKILVALAAFHAAAMPVLPGRLGARHRGRTAFWWSYGAVAVVLVIVLGAYLRNLPLLYA